ncbi:hypothetical protein GQR58_023703 [Nymphon striatum]|nr:hypothetical protein GQR58_023703 [Nymphon striatum]
MYLKSLSELNNMYISFLQSSLFLPFFFFSKNLGTWVVNKYCNFNSDFNDKCNMFLSAFPYFFLGDYETFDFSANGNIYHFESMAQNEAIECDLTTPTTCTKNPYLYTLYCLQNHLTIDHAISYISHNILKTFKIIKKQLIDSISINNLFCSIGRCNQKSSCGPNGICKDLNFISNNKSRQHCICRKHTCGQNCEIDNFFEIIDGDVLDYDFAFFILSGNIKIDIETCKDRCIAEKKCKSFVYLNSLSKCHLKVVNEFNSGAQFRTVNGTTYGRRTCKCEKNENLCLRVVTEMVRIFMYLELISWVLAKDIYDITKGACPVKMQSDPISFKNIASIAEKCSLTPWEMCTGFCCIEIEPGNFECFSYDQTATETESFEHNDNAMFYKRIPRCNQKSSCGPNEICKDLNYIANNKSRQHCICRKHTCGQNCEIDNFIETKDVDLYGSDIIRFTLSGILEIDIEICKDLCIAEKECKSFVYYSSKCLLKRANDDTVPLRSYRGLYYGRRTCNCENESC